jgi:translation elongation factor EF-G
MQKYLKNKENKTNLIKSNQIKISQSKLEPVCCKKKLKIVPDQLLVWEIRAL